MVLGYIPGHKIIITEKNLEKIPDYLADLIFGLSIEYSIKTFSVRPVGRDHTFLCGIGERYWLVSKNEIEFKDYAISVDYGSSWYRYFKIPISYEFVVVIFPEIMEPSPRFHMQVFKLEDNYYVDENKN